MTVLQHSRFKPLRPHRRYFPFRSYLNQVEHTALQKPAADSSSAAHLLGLFYVPPGPPPPLKKSRTSASSRRIRSVSVDRFSFRCRHSGPFMTALRGSSLELPTPSWRYHSSEAGHGLLHRRSPCVAYLRPARTMTRSSSLTRLVVPEQRLRRCPDRPFNVPPGPPPTHCPHPHRPLILTTHTFPLPHTPSHLPKDG